MKSESLLTWIRLYIIVMVLHYLIIPQEGSLNHGRPERKINEVYLHR